MTSLDFTRVAKALAAAAGTVTGLPGGKSLRTVHYIDPKPATPIFMVGERGPGQFDGAFARGVDGSGSQGIPFSCRVYAASVDEPRVGAELLDALLKPDGPTSIRQAIAWNGGTANDPTLGGACQACRVVSWDGYAIYTVGNSGFIGAIWRVEVW